MTPLRQAGDALGAGPVGLIACAADGAVVFANGRAAQLFGLEPQALVGLPIDAPRLALRSAEGRLLTGGEHPLHAALAGGEAVPWRSVFVPGDEPLWLSVYATAADGGAQLWLVDQLVASRPEDARAQHNQMLARILTTTGLYVYSGEMVAGEFVQRVTGPNAGEMLGGEMPGSAQDDERYWREHIHPDDLPIYDGIDEALSRGESSEIEYRLVGEDGVIRWMHESLHTWIDDDGRVIVDGFIRDVSQSKSIAEALNETEQRFHAVLSAVDDYVFAGRYRPDGSYTTSFESVTTASFLGLDRSSGDTLRDWRSRVHPDDRAVFDAGIDAQRRGESTAFEFRIAQSGGGWRWVYARARATSRADGSVVVEGILTDVTPLKAIETKLQVSEERFHALAEIMPIGMFSTDERGRCVYANSRWSQLTGRTRGEAVGDGWREIFHHEDRDSVIGMILNPTAGEREVECRVLHTSGELRRVIVTGTAIHGPDGELSGFVGTLHDVTILRENEDQLMNALAEVNSANAQLEVAREDAEFRSRTDALTGVANRRAYREDLEAELERAREAGETPAVLMIDVDKFKAINDTYGHASGDAVLVETVQRLRAAVRATDLVARWGGEEFAVLLPNVPNEDILLRVAEAVRESVAAAPFLLPDGRRIEVRCSVGAALARSEAWEVDVLMDEADHALYAAKRRGRNQVRLASQLTEGSEVAEEPEPVRIAQAMALAASVREGMPLLHADQVAEIAARVAERLGLGPETVQRARLGGWLHDVGKVAVPDSILSKPGRLSPEEWVVMRTHAEIGEQLIQRVPALAEAAAGVRNHHERWDGTGYPDRLRGPDIPIEARIIAVADAFSAITSDRCYARGRERGDAITELRRSAGTHLDPQAVQALIEVLDDEASASRSRLQRQSDADAA